MKTYKVTITEKLQMTVEVEAQCALKPRGWWRKTGRIMITSYLLTTSKRDAFKGKICKPSKYSFYDIGK